jgi:predicted transcriptional regulator
VDLGILMIDVLAVPTTVNHAIANPMTKRDLLLIEVLVKEREPNLLRSGEVEFK